MVYAFCFKATDENGNRSQQDILFDNYLSEGLEYTLQKVCEFDPVKEDKLICEFVKYYSDLYKN